MKNVGPLVLSALTVALMWFVAWLAGYDFDERNFWVGWWGFVSIFAGVIVFFASKDYR